jgi:cytochrome c biogenesis protein CcmG, thiol:disulfide interchange protein DsbE
MTPKSLSLAAVAVAILAVLVVGLLQLRSSPSGSGSAQTQRLTLAEVRTRLAGSPATLAGVHAQAGQLISGGLPALRARLAQLRGTPIVVNKWASWCEPCRDELGAFQRVSVSRGREVAFIGIDSGDSSRASAQSFLRSFPVGYPSYYDPSGRAGAAVTDSSFTPVTVFYDRRGKLFIHQGPYTSVEKLERDISRYALEA